MDVPEWVFAPWVDLNLKRTKKGLSGNRCFKSRISCSSVYSEKDSKDILFETVRRRAAQEFYLKSSDAICQWEEEGHALWQKLESSLTLKATWS